MIPTPPDEPLDDAARARQRERVLAAAHGEERDVAQGGAARRRRWAAPAGVAAAVLLVASASTGVALLTRDGDGPGPDAGHAVGSVPPTAEPSESTSPTSADPPDGAAQCDAAVQEVLPGADVVATVPVETGEARFYATAYRYTMCTSEPVVTVRRFQELGISEVDIGHPRIGWSSFDVSTDIVKTAGGDLATTYTAGGLVRHYSDDRDLRYTFPGGESTAAVVAEGDDGRHWWVMTHTTLGTHGPDSDPISVEVTGPFGAATVELRWALDTCAQANHGC